MPEVADKTPQGVVAILISPENRAIANAADFSTCFPGGFTLQEVQTTRARNALAFKAISELSSPLLSKSIDDIYDAKKIVDNMCRNGCKIVYVPIGYNEEELL